MLLVDDYYSFQYILRIVIGSLNGEKKNMEKRSKVTQYQSNSFEAFWQRECRSCWLNILEYFSGRNARQSYRKVDKSASKKPKKRQINGTEKSQNVNFQSSIAFP